MKSKISAPDLKNFLDEKVDQYNQQSFIINDPISIPHRYSGRQDIEITGLIAAVFAWGQRKTIIRKSEEFFSYMDFAPYDFIRHHSENDLIPFLKFRHRTFNATDALYFIQFLRWHYQQWDSLEEAFLPEVGPGRMEDRLIRFFNYFFSLPDFPPRTTKHIPTPQRKSACKRLNMYLRWMVRSDQKGVDFGLWTRIQSAALICPCDLHVDRVARKLGLIQRKQTDWLTAVELTEKLKEFDPQDPVKYDFALFGLGIEEKF